MELPLSPLVDSDCFPRESGIGAGESHPDHYLASGNRTLALGLPALAFDLFAEGLRRFPGHPGLIHRAALALANAGSLTRAGAFLAPLLGRTDLGAGMIVEVASLAGRLAKERCHRTRDPERRWEAAAEAALHYLRAFRVDGNPFPGINAATMVRLVGEAGLARSLALEVRGRCLADPGAAGGHQWRAATLGEAAMHLGDDQEAERCYREALALAGGSHGEIASMRRQLFLLEPLLPVAAHLRSILSLPQVAFFAGNRIDSPGRQPPRFPPEAVGEAAARIEAALARLNIGIGCSGLANGGDLLFAEALLARGGTLHVVLPFRDEDFIRVSVASAGQVWVERFQKALRRATSVTYGMRDPGGDDPTPFTYAARLLAGAAVTHAASLGESPLLLALLAREGAHLPGGTEESIDHWRSLGLPAHIIDLSGWVAPTGSGETSTKSGCDPAVKSPPAVIETDGSPVPGSGRGWEMEAGRWDTPLRDVKTMLFADVSGFSRIPERDAPAFYSRFQAMAKRAIDAAPVPPFFSNTWGDGLFVVFDRVTDAAATALCLRDEGSRQDWTEVGLPAETGLRIALHAGPVFLGHDRVIDRPSCFGTHITIAARIEPVTAVGAVYLDERTVWLLAASGGGDHACDLVGEVELAKGYGKERLFRLRRAAETE
ncbi:MAG: hypothetical protein HQL59_05025 [Magnetococcales bacterium]|nr:hypothetical protein [Magnetococcales bacterium]